MFLQALLQPYPQNTPLVYIWHFLLLQFIADMENTWQSTFWTFQSPSQISHAGKKPQNEIDAHEFQDLSSRYSVEGAYPRAFVEQTSLVF